MSNKQQYISICEANPQIPVFLQYRWMDAVCTDWDVAIAMNGDKVAGVWPYNREQKMGVSIVRTPKLTPYQGPFVLYPQDLKASNKDGFEHETIAALIKQLPAAKVWDVSTLPGQKQAGLLKANGFGIDTRQTFLIDLLQEEQALLGNMKESLRRNIKAGSTELSIEQDNAALTTLFEYQKHTLDKKDVMQAHSLADMQKLMQACIGNNCGAIYTAKQGADTLAIVWNLWDANCSYYFMGAQKPANDNYRAMPALLWHCMKEAKQRGNTSFDLEGSMDQGVEKFFRSFGAKRELYLVLQKNDSLIWKLKSILLRG
ncbi:MAG: GNAT family N-acetyltransferase [Flavipsychrobacter sp.]|nr:GNAT family N-acetyltransferase [Flavipsychrobacter sp.]